MTLITHLGIDIEISRGDFSLRANFSTNHGLTAFYGRSGTGKTTLANAIAGLEKPNFGKIVLGTRTLYNSDKNVIISPEKRRIGYIFQDGRLFPHLSVQKNLLYGRRCIPSDIEFPDFDEIINLLDLQDLLYRHPINLSGGEKQRVAFGRAILSAPELLIMDEPLAALDPGHKDEIFPFIQRLRDNIGVPIIYISHALEEIIRLADYMVIFDKGITVASGPVDRIMSQLNLRTLIGHHEAGAVLQATICGQDKTFGLTELNFKRGRLFVAGIDLPLGTSVRVRIRASNVSLSLTKPSDTSILNVLPAKVIEITENFEPQMDVLLDIGIPLIARITRRSLTNMKLQPGTAVFALIKSTAIDRRSLGLVDID
ncbi:MAG: molybdenum ABC transporter ATP-binding protein [Magnetovibrio sp.]|nr:molybdenum ABC transporter ATP-binding protein [Magnetovibrio sp.]